MYFFTNGEMVISVLRYREHVAGHGNVPSDSYCLFSEMSRHPNVLLWLCTCFKEYFLSEFPPHLDYCLLYKPSFFVSYTCHDIRKLNARHYEKKIYCGGHTISLHTFVEISIFSAPTLERKLQDGGRLVPPTADKYSRNYK